MLGFAVVMGMLAVPWLHLATAHRIFVRHSPTAHERRHAQRTMWQRVAADLAWLAYLAATLAAGLALR